MTEELYEYKSVNVSLEPSADPRNKPNVETAANRWAKKGWRTVSVIPSRGTGYADVILVERKKDSERKND